MSSLRTYLRRMWRASLTPQSLLTLEEAVEALPGLPTEARAWLTAAVEPVGEAAGEAIYSWGEVMVAIGARREVVEHKKDLVQGHRSRYHGDANRDGSQWLTIRQAAEELQVSERLLRRLLAEGKLETAAIRAGRTWRLHRERLATALGLSRENGDGLASQEEAQESGDGQQGELLVHLLEGRTQQDPHPGYRVLGRSRGETAAEGVRGKDGRRRNGRAKDFRRFLSGASE